MLISILLSFFSLFYWLSIWMLFVLVIEEQSSEMVLKQVYRVWFRGSPNWIRWPCEHAFLLKQKFTSNKILAVIEEIRLVPPTCCETRVHRYIEVALDVYFAKTPIWNSVRHQLIGSTHRMCTLTRSSKDECSTGSNNHLRLTDLFRS